MNLIFDIETNGFLEKLDRVHCVSIIDIDTEKLYSFNPSNIRDALEMLSKADSVIGHHIKGFDIPAILKVYPSFYFKEGCKIVDTLQLSRLCYPDLKQRDFGFRKKKPEFPGQLIGRHGLEAWGWRLGLHKGDYAKECKAKGIDPWAEYSDEMGSYCDLDAQVNLSLYKKLQEKLSKLAPKTIELEIQARDICDKQESFGVFFDKKAAEKLYTELVTIRESLHTELVDTFGSWYVREAHFVPKRDNKRMRYLEGCPLSKVKLIEFNPGSTQHIARCLQKMRGWKPTVYTDKGQVKVDEEVLSGLKYPEVPKLLEYLMVNKRISQLAEGKAAWLKKVKQDSRIYGKIDTMGTVTGRCSHNAPNLGQVPAVGKPYGKECRSLFIPEPGWEFVGADASGLELRCLAHYMAKWDNGAYAQEILSGDIHTANQKAAGLPTRDNAKTFIYGLLYGAGNPKIGQIIGKGAKAGKQLKDQFMANLPAFGKLLNAVTGKAKRDKYIRGIDGRVIYIRSAHSALNFLLQGCGAIIMKQAMINYHKILRDQGYVHGVDYRQVLHVHDEFQGECKPGLAEIVGQAMVNGIRQVTDQFEFRCPLDGEYKVGNSWAETH